MREISLADIVEPGDIILSRSGTWLSRTIRKFGKILSGGARFSHSALVVDKEKILEALYTVTESPLKKYDKQDIVVWRNPEWTAEQRQQIVERLMEIRGEAYGFSKLPLFMLDSVFRTYFFTSRLGVTSFKVCSTAITWAAFKVTGDKEPFGCPWRSTQPDTIDDWFTNIKGFAPVFLNIPK